MLYSGSLAETAGWGRSAPLWKKSCALVCKLFESQAGSHSIRPGGNSGLSSNGVMGLGEGVTSKVLHARLKSVSVDPISGCVVYSLGVAL